MATDEINAAVAINDVPDGTEIVASGRWTIDQAGALFARLERLPTELHGHIRIKANDVEVLDTAGAWLLYRTIRELRAAGATVEMEGLSTEKAALVEVIGANDKPCVMAPKHPSTFRGQVEDIGRATIFIWSEFLRLVSYLGLVTATLIRSLIHPSRLRLTSTVYHMEQVGLKAMTIVGLMSFLIGIVIAQQGEFQLKQFGAQIFVVNLVAVTILREIGILLTAIMVAGRSGSAFTAQIGSMVLREEVDAMRTLGLDPIELLVIPRLLALLIMMPILTFYADIMGLIGGGVFAWFSLNITPDTFIERVNQSIELKTFMVGMIKAPVFAAIIAVCGCFEGMSVKASAESVGRRTTRSVVESIFLVIVFDALFSIFFSAISF